MLVYIPSVEINPGLYGLSDFGRDYILKHTYLSALKKLDRYLSKVCRNGVPEQIDAYSKYCVKLHHENALLDISPEKLIGSELCFPEREISDHPPIQWEESSPQEIITEKGVTSEIQSKEEPEASGGESSSLLEESHPEEEFGDAVTNATNAIKTASEASVTNGASELPKLDTSGEISKDEKVIENV